MTLTRLIALLLLLAVTIPIAIVSNAQEQPLLLNEVESDSPGTTDESCNYFEVLGQTPGASIPAGTIFLSLNLDVGNPGFVNTVANIGGQTLGSNGTLTGINTFEGPCTGRTFPAGTTLFS